MKRIWNVKIGLEIHAQLISASKLFSRSSASCLGLPNSSVSLFDAAYPGTLPVLNRACVDQAVRAAIALNCKVNQASSFERKHYFYLDLPLGYQITQRLSPIAVKGRLPFRYDIQENGKMVTLASEVAIDRIQLEQDSGKSIHDQEESFSLVDLNRAGVALIEIVFEPNLTTPEQAAGVLRTTQELLRHIGVSDGNMDTGSIRCDVNVSVSESNSSLKSNKVEIKNLSSLQRVRDAAAYEARRQIELLEKGEEIPQETRSFDVATGETFRLRTKESDVDYRYMPEPDLPTLLLSDEKLRELEATVAELPAATIERLMKSFGLTEGQAETVVTREAVLYFDTAAKLVLEEMKGEIASISTLFNWVFGELFGHLNTEGCKLSASPVTAGQLAGVVTLLLQNELTGLQAKSLLSNLYSENNPTVAPAELATRLGLKKITGEEQLRQLCLEALADEKNKQQLEKLRSGNRRMIQYFMGAVMKRTNSQGDPKVIAKLLGEIVDAWSS